MINKRISKDWSYQPKHWFTAFCLIHWVAWTAITALTRANPPFDSVEGVAWGNQWQWGYDKHPPLAPWLTAFTVRLLGSVDGSIYLLGALSVILCFWATWRLGQKFLPESYALIGTLLLEGIYYYNIAAMQFNPNVLMLPLWALSNLSFYHALTTQKPRHWLLLGLWMGLAMLTKYESALLLFMIGILIMITPEGRQSFRHLGFYLGIILFSAILAPNVLWLIRYDFLPFTYTADRLNSGNLSPLLRHIYHPFLYLIEQIGALIPVFLLFSPFYRCKTDNWQLNKLDQTYLILMGLGPFVLVALLSAATGMWIHSLWAFPFFSFTGFLLLAWRKPIFNVIALRRFGILFTFFFCAILILRSLFLLYGPHWQHKANAAHFPGKRIANTITTHWRQQFATPLPYVAGYRTLVEHIAVYSTDHPIPYFAWSQTQSPWIDEQKIKRQGAVFVWFEKQASSTIPQEIAARFPGAIAQPVQTFQQETEAKLEKVRVGIAFLPPKKF